MKNIQICFCSVCSLHGHASILLVCVVEGYWDVSPVQSEAAAGAADPGGGLGGARPGLLLLHVDRLVDWQILHVEVCPAPGELGGQLGGEASPRHISLLGHISAQGTQKQYKICNL